VDRPKTPLKWICLPWRNSQGYARKSYCALYDILQSRPHESLQHAIWKMPTTCNRRLWLPPGGDGEDDEDLYKQLLVNHPMNHQNPSSTALSASTTIPVTSISTFQATTTTPTTNIYCNEYHSRGQCTRIPGLLDSNCCGHKDWNEFLRR
jgi:hypothetical protein